MFMKLDEVENQEEQKKVENHISSLAKDKIKDKMIDVAIDEAAELATITMPLPELEMLLKLFKGIELALNQNVEKGIQR